MILEAVVLQKFEKIDHDYVVSFLERAVTEAKAKHIDMEVYKEMAQDMWHVSIAGGHVSFVPEKVVPYVVEGMLDVADSNGYTEED